MCHLIRKSGSRFSKPWMFDTINNLILCLLWISRGALMVFQGLVEWYPVHKPDGVLREVWVVGQIDGRWIIRWSLINLSKMAASIILSVDTFICLVLHREKNYLWYKIFCRNWLVFIGITHTFNLAAIHARVNNSHAFITNNGIQK